jgi:hypothetical protein
MRKTSLSQGLAIPTEVLGSIFVHFFNKDFQVDITVKFDIEIVHVSDPSKPTNLRK